MSSFFYNVHTSSFAFCSLYIFQSSRAKYDTRCLLPCAFETLNIYVCRSCSITSRGLFEAYITLPSNVALKRARILKKVLEKELLSSGEFTFSLSVRAATIAAKSSGYIYTCIYFPLTLGTRTISCFFANFTSFFHFFLKSISMLKFGVMPCCVFLYRTGFLYCKTTTNFFPFFFCHWHFLSV